MELWQQLLKQSVSSVEQLVDQFGIKKEVAIDFGVSPRGWHET